MSKQKSPQNESRRYEQQSSILSEENVSYGKPSETIYGNYKSNFFKGMRAVWATKHTEDTENDRQLYIKTTIRELVVYVGFLVVLMIITFGMSNYLTYYYTNFHVGLFATPFSGGSSVDDFWKFLQGPLLSGLYVNQWYNNVNVTRSERNYVLYANKLIGVPRIRQVRVRNDSCAIVTDFQSDLKLCYAPYSLSVESTDLYGLGNSTAWNYTSQVILNGRTSDGLITSYGGGGYYVDLNLTQSNSLKTINFLFNNLWIDRGTRAVLVDFTVYNAQLNLFVVIKLIAEFPATGGMIPSSSFRTVKLMRYSSPSDYFVMTVELIFLVYIIYYIVEEVLEIKKHHSSYFFSFWNCLDVVVIGLSVASVGFNIYRTISVENTLQSLLKNRFRYANFDNISYLQVQFDYIIAITLFFAWIKIFKYISFNQTMSQLNETLGKSAYDLSGFAVMFIVIFLAFTQLGYLWFGTQVDIFSSFITTVFTLLRIIIGDFDFTQLNRSNRILGVIYFVIYIFFVFFVLFNMFMAIIMDSYTEVKEELATKSNEFEMADYIKERAGVIMAKLNFRRDRLIDIQNAMGMADTDGDNKIDFEEWKSELRKRGYADSEIEVVFKKYDIDGDNVLDIAERRKMQIELEKQKAELNQEIMQSENDDNLGNSMNGSIQAPMVDIEQLQILDQSVNRMENKLIKVVSKIDGALKNFGKVEKNNTKKRELLKSILKTLKADENLSEPERHERLEALIRDVIERMNQNDSRHKARSKSEVNY